jgi:hypothetical protein
MRITRLTEKNLASPNSGIVPSWSWLSYPVSISFDFFGRHLKNTEIYNYITIHNYKLSWTGEPFISDIKSSRLTISGPSRETFLEVAPKGRQYKPPYFLINGEIPDFTENALPWSYAAQFDREQERSPDKFLCILVRHRVDIITGYRTETFLILEPINLIIENQMFRRIGLGIFRGYSNRFSMNIRKTVSLV